MRAIRLGLPESDITSSYDLEHIFDGSQYPPETVAYKLKVAEVFASSLYSNACKKYFAASNIHNELMFSVADQFLTEEIILSHVKREWSGEMEGSYFKAMMTSSHLSERIIVTAFGRVDGNTRKLSLELTPDYMLTPEVVKSWLAHVCLVWGWGTGFATSLATSRVRKAHPEYEGLPDEWMVKLFIGK